MIKLLLLIPLVALAILAAGCAKYDHPVGRCQVQNDFVQIFVKIKRTDGKTSEESAPLAAQICQDAADLVNGSK